MSFLTELSKLLLAAGVTSTQFTQLSEVAFFRAASQDARFRNSRINQSSVAAMTGLNRAKIRVLMRAEKKKTYSQSESRRERLINAWMSEAEFLTSAGEPRQLRLAGNKGSFSSLAKRHGGDVPPKAILRDFIRRKIAKVSGDYVRLARNAREVRDVKRLEQISLALATTLSAPKGSDVGRAVKVLAFDILHPAPTAVGRILLQRRIAKSLKGFMEELDVICGAIALEANSAGSKTRRMGKTSVLLLNQD